MRAFDLFKELTPQDFEDALRNGVNSTKIGALFPPLPEQPASFPTPASEQAFNAQLRRAEDQRERVVRRKKGRR